MIKATITPDFNLKIPESFREDLKAGQEVAMVMDPQGRLIVTPLERIKDRLSETFGMWKDMESTSSGIAFMDEVRKGHRLNASGR